MTAAVVLAALLLIVVTVLVCSWTFKDTKLRTTTERYEVPKQQLSHPVDMFFNDDPYTTGMVRALWGPLAPIHAKNDTHLTLRNTPWCFSTMTQYPECERRTMEAGQCREAVPNEENKI